MNETKDSSPAQKKKGKGWTNRKNQELLAKVRDEDHWLGILSEAPLNPKEEDCYIHGPEFRFMCFLDGKWKNVSPLEVSWIRKVMEENKLSKQDERERISRKIHDIRGM
jgi:signal transduction histidine kinase